MTTTGVLTGNIAIDALIFSSWSAAPYTSARITYCFLQTVPPGATAEDANGFTPLTAPQQDAIRSVLAQYAALTKITFVETSDINSQLRFGSNDQNAQQTAGYSDLPDAKLGTQVNTYFNNRDPNNFDFSEGSFGITTFIHEIGHALGLKHPGNYNGFGIAPYLPTNLDNTDYSIMSLIDGHSYGINQQNPSSPMLYDILALQYLYGANTQWKAGNDVYSFRNNSAPQSIWDAGGVNTFDFSKTTEGARIDLRAGSFSESAPNLNNISIAHGTTIQNAIGGRGNDRVYTNDGVSNIDGGRGVDTVFFNSAQTNYTLAHTNTGLTITSRTIPNNVVTVNNVEYLSFSDGKINDKLGKVFTATTDNSNFTGGTKIDEVLYSNNRSDYAIQSLGNHTFTVTQKNGKVDTLLNIDRLQFGDGSSVALDIDGNGGRTYGLYQAVFNRLPDSGGLGFWINALDKGIPFIDVTRTFITSPEFVTTYSSLGTSDFVKLLYVNVLHRTAEPGGLAFWSGALDSKIIDRANVVLNFTASSEFQGNLATEIGNGFTFTPWLG